ncbi:ChaN family lipoprotein [Pseudorhodobacter sp. W20_MBD10_FR17]|uniref:ChaN family lipoprotein n=1 Tax=Pseudorhodobacter sp. W20_MBD10_FR17 TaxID=3240266 RepID=UPI003F961139
MTYNTIFLAAVASVLGGFALAQQVGVADLPTMAPAQIVILGEIHDNPTHHLTQATLVARWAPKAVVFEMLTPAQVISAQVKLKQGVSRTDEGELQAALGWDGTGWPAFSMYYPIFTALGDANIYGAALDRNDVRRAINDGAAAVFGTDAALYGLGKPLLASEQSAREADQMAAHCDALPVEMLSGMVEAQRLRDAAFAKMALAALHDTGGPVVVITGSGHADRLRGIPAALAVAAPDVTVFSIGQLEGEANDAPPFDRWIVTAPTPREDPCKAFQKP